MREISIIFKTEMIQAILEDRKTQTRRMKRLEEINKDPDLYQLIKFENGIAIFYNKASEVWERIESPYQIGDHLWVKEIWAGDDITGVIYKADGHEMPFEDGEIILQKWESPLFMSKKYARLWLEVTDIKVEKLQEITNQDTMKEGVIKTHRLIDINTAKIHFYVYWNNIHKKNLQNQWGNNPWIFVINFKRIKK